MTLTHLRIVTSPTNTASGPEAQGILGAPSHGETEHHSSKIDYIKANNSDNSSELLQALSDLSHKGIALPPSMLAIIASSFENIPDILDVRLIEGLSQPVSDPVQPEGRSEADNADTDPHLLPSQEAPFDNETVSDIKSVPSNSEPEIVSEYTHPLWPKPARLIVNALKKENEALRLQIDELHIKLLSAQEVADTDVLTPTLNRRAFIREVQRALADCRRYNEEAAIIFLDLDGFKSINDDYGHAAGDKALIYVSHLLKECVREGDSVGRLGGDEFAILLRRADLNAARLKAMKLEAELAHGSFEYQKLYLKLAGSFGVRAYCGQATAEIWIDEADAAMFLVKKPSDRLKT
jgi:diguanylate cyclase (GGDEF)-like protein